MKLERIAMTMVITALAASAWSAPNTVVNGAAPQVVVTIAQAREVAVIGPDGKTTLVHQPLTNASVGDVIVYTLTATNTGTTPASGAVVEDPIPQGTTVILESLVTQRPTLASLDNGKSWSPFPATIKQTLSNGTEVELAAPADRYTHLRWALDGTLTPGQSRELSFKVRVK
ncbi:MAG: hypothetical protein U0V87_14510 [Acidobacteriota bacterium]